MKSGARIFGAGRFVGVEHLPGAKRKAAARVEKTPTWRRLVGKVHIAKAELGLADDDYRAILLDVAGRRSAADCTESELVALVERFKARGWKPAQPVGRGQPKPADHKPAAKARALWISLHHLNAIADPSDRALEAFATRQLGCARLQWADQGLMYRLIEAEKAIGERHGWAQGLDGIAPAAKVIVLKRRLVEAILGKLQAAGLAPADWNVSRAAFEFAGMEVELLFATASELDIVAKAFGDKLREGGR